MNGADLVAQALRAHGVTIVSTLIGNGIDPVLIAAQHAGIRVVDTHNEQTAAYMAETYARFTARIGVCAVSSSVGFTNALIGVVNAGFDGAPMLLISGASDHRICRSRQLPGLRPGGRRRPSLQVHALRGSGRQDPLLRARGNRHSHQRQAWPRAPHHSARRPGAMTAGQASRIMPARPEVSPLPRAVTRRQLPVQRPL